MDALNDDDTRELIMSLSKDQLDPETSALVNSLKKDYGIVDTSGEEAFNKQNPITAGINKAAEVMTPVVDGIGQATQGISDLREQGINALPKPVGTYLNVIDPTKRAFDALQFARTGAKPLGEASDYVLTGKAGVHENLRAPIGRALGLLSTAVENNPLPASAGEAVIATVPELGAAGLGKLAKIFPDLPGVRPFMDKAPMKDSVKASNDAFKARTTKLGYERLEAEMKLQSLADNMSPTEDSVAYGDKAKLYLKVSTDLEAAPLKQAADELRIETDKLGSAPIEHLADPIGQIREELLGTIKTGEDNAALKIVDDYLGKVTKAQDGTTFDAYGVPVPKQPTVSVGDLLKDRGRIGKEYVRELAAGGRDTPQSRALGRLQGVIDDEISNRLESSPGLKSRVEGLRTGWRNFYETYYSDSANGIRNAKSADVVKAVLKDEHSIDSAKVIAPQILEQARRVEMTRLVNKMKGAADPVKALAEGLRTDQPGYYERLFSSEERTVLSQYAEKAREYPHIVEQYHSMLEELHKEGVTERRATDKGATQVVDRRAAKTPSKLVSVVDWLKGAQRTKGVVPGEISAIATVASLAKFIDPETAILISLSGGTPAAMAWAWYKASPKMRTSITRAVSNAAKYGPKAATYDLQLIRRINRGDDLNNNTLNVLYGDNKEEPKASPKPLAKQEESVDTSTDVEHYQPGFNETYQWPVKSDE